MNDKFENEWLRDDGWLNAVVLANVAVSVVFAVLTLVQAPSGEAGGAGYALVRAGVLLIAAGVVAVRRRLGESVLLAWIATAVQLGDAIVGLCAGDLAKTIGPAVLAALTAVCALWRMRARGAAED